MLDLISRKRDGGRWFVPVSSISRMQSLRSVEEVVPGDTQNAAKGEAEDEAARRKAQQDADRRREKEEAMAVIGAEAEGRREEERDRRAAAVSRAQDEDEERCRLEIERQRKVGLAERRRVAEDKWLCQREEEELVKQAGERERKKDAIAKARSKTRARRESLPSSALYRQSTPHRLEEIETEKLKEKLHDKLSMSQGRGRSESYGDTELRHASLGGQGEEGMGAAKANTKFGGSRLKLGKPREERRASLPPDLASPPDLFPGGSTWNPPRRQGPQPVSHTVPKASRARRSSLPHSLFPDGQAVRGGKVTKAGRRSSIVMRSLPPPQLGSPPLGPTESLYNLNPHAVIPDIAPQEQPEPAGDQVDYMMSGASSIVDRIRRKGPRRHSVV